MPKRTRNDFDDDDGNREVPAWLHCSPLYQMFLENAADGVDEEKGDVVPSVPHDAPVCAVDCSDARLMYRTFAYWQLDFKAFPTSFFAAWFQLGVADREAIVDAVRAFHAELHPDTCCTSMLKRDDEPLYALWWSLAGEAPRRVRTATIMEALEHQAVRCLQLLDGLKTRIGGDTPTAKDIWSRFLTSLRSGHFIVADLLFKRHNLHVYYTDSWSRMEEFYETIQSSCNLAVYEWAYARDINVLKNTLSGMVRVYAANWSITSAAASSSAVEIVAWYYGKNSLREFEGGVLNVVMEAIQVADFGVLEWVLANVPAMELGPWQDFDGDIFWDIWDVAVLQPRTDVLEWLVQKAPLPWFDNKPLINRGGYREAARVGNLDVMQWMHARGVLLNLFETDPFDSRTVLHAAVEYCCVERSSSSSPDKVQRTLAMVDWLLQTLTDEDLRLRVLRDNWMIFKVAIRASHATVELLQSLIDRGFQTSSPTATAEQTAAQEHVMYHTLLNHCDGWYDGGAGPILEWLASHFPRSDSADHMLNIITRHWHKGNIVDVLEWMHQRWKVDWNKLRTHAYNITSFSFRDLAAVIRFLHGKGVMPFAATLGKVLRIRGPVRNQVVKFLMDNNCAWDYNAMFQAVKRGDRTVIEWLRARRCPWENHKGSLRLAVDELVTKSTSNRTFKATLMWLRAQKGFPKK